MGAPSPKSGMTPRSRGGSADVSAGVLPEPLASLVDVPVLLELVEPSPVDAGAVMISGVELKPVWFVVDAWQAATSKRARVCQISTTPP